MTKLKLAAVLLLPLGIVVAGTGALMLKKAPVEPPAVAEENPNIDVNTSREDPPDSPRPLVPATVAPPLNPAEKYLGLCEKKLKGFESFVAQVQRTSTDNTFQASEVYEGTVKYRQPDMSLLEMHKKGKPQIMEKYVLAGPFLYEFAPPDKTVRVHEVSTFRALPWGFGNWRSWFFEPVLAPFSHFMKADETRRSFHCKLVKEDEWYIYISLTPRTPETKADFQSARLVLMKQTYLPRELWFEQPNGNEIKWDIPKIEVNVPLQREEFTKPKIPQGWQVLRIRREPDSPPRKKVPPPDPPPGD